MAAQQHHRRRRVGTRGLVEMLQPVAYVQQPQPLAVEVALPTPRSMPAPDAMPVSRSRSLGCCPFMPDVCYEGCWDPSIATCKRFCGALGDCLCCADPCYQ